MIHTTVPTLLSAYRTAKTEPTAVFRVDWCTSWNVKEFFRWFRKCLNEKINRGDARAWRKLDPEYQVNLRWDAYRINDYAKRIRSSGSRNLLRTAEMRRRYPHVNNQAYDE